MSAGNADEVEAILGAASQRKMVNFSMFNILSVACALKKMLLSLPSPLIPPATLDMLLTTQRIFFTFFMPSQTFLFLPSACREFA